MDKNIPGAEVGEKTSFTDIVDIIYLTPENSEFSMTKNGFLKLVSSQDVKPEKLYDENSAKNDNSENNPKEHHSQHGGHGRKAPAEIKYTSDGRRDYGRVILHRAFPFDRPDNIISVQQEDGFEIGIIRSLSDFDAETVRIINESLDRKYYIPEIKKIISAKDRFGFVYFKCETDSGICDFVVRNPFGSIIRISDIRIIILDIDGNRYSVMDVTKLDRKSYRKIELYV